jgi:hypothetical protein
LNPRPSGYEPDELPGCSIPRWVRSIFRRILTTKGPIAFVTYHIVRNVATDRQEEPLPQPNQIECSPQDWAQTMAQISGCRPASSFPQKASEGTSNVLGNCPNCNEPPSKIDISYSSIASNLFKSSSASQLSLRRTSTQTKPRSPA